MNQFRVRIRVFIYEFNLFAENYKLYFLTRHNILDIELHIWISEIVSFAVGKTIELVDNSTISEAMPNDMYELPFQTGSFLINKPVKYLTLSLLKYTQETIDIIITGKKSIAIAMNTISFTSFYKTLNPNCHCTNAHDFFKI